MADETKTDETTPKAEDAAQAKAAAEDTQKVEEGKPNPDLATSPAPAEDSSPAAAPDLKIAPHPSLYDSNVGSVQAPAPVTYPPNNTARVQETNLILDRPAVAGDPEFIKVKHLGVNSDPAPLPLAGANGNLRRPEEVFSERA